MATIDFDSASKTISQLWQCYLEESNGETATVERCFTQLLDLQSKSRVSDGLVLIHYLDFVRRSKGLDEALALFADLVASESDQVTPDVHLYVASCLQWAFSDVKNARIKSSTDTLHVCHSARGKFLTDSTMFAAEFIAFSVGDYRLAVKEAARLLLNRKSTARHQTLWDLWERISGEFGFSVSAKSRKNKARNLKDDIHSENNNDVYNEGSLAVDEQDSLGPEKSWLDLKPSAFKLSQNFEFSGSQPDSALLEHFIDPQQNLDDERDGGNGNTNHIFRPDVTRMMRFVPAEDVQRKIDIPRVVRSFMSCLPPRGPRGVNANTLAESSLRLLVSISLPKPVTDEMIYNVDRRTRLAVEQRRRQVVDGRLSGMPHNPSQAIKTLASTKEEQNDESLAVKNEEITESVAYGDLIKPRREKF